MLPDALSTVANVTPLKHVILLIQDPWLGFGWNTAELIVVLAMLVVATVASARWLRWDLTRLHSRDTRPLPGHQGPCSSKFSGGCAH